MNAIRLHNGCMPTITIRNVPAEVHEALGREARAQGQSLQAYLLTVLAKQARFSRNRQLLKEIEADLAAGGGADETAPNTAELIARARVRGDVEDVEAQAEDESGRGGAA